MPSIVVIVKSGSHGNSNAVPLKTFNYKSEKKTTLVPVYKLLSYVHLIARQAKFVIIYKFQLVLGLKVS